MDRLSEILKKRKELIKYFSIEDLQLVDENLLEVSSIENIKFFIKIVKESREELTNDKLTKILVTRPELTEFFTLGELYLFKPNQLRLLDVESLNSVLRIKENVKKDKDRNVQFWEEYPNRSIEEKLKFWGGSLFRSMREQEESGLNPYTIYSERWLKETLEKEPQFMEMLPSIYNIWGGMFDSNKVDRILHKLYHKLR